ncbi:MAG: oligosaccharide flippase family protein [Anaerorhabdus sp.]
MNKRGKQSFIAGALTSTAGIFISKAIGLFYIVPFTAIATENNMFFYSQAYTYYEVLLNISAAGFPFAIAAMVAKYSNKNDYKTVMLIRRLAMSIMLLTGFIAAVFFILFSSQIASNALGSEATINDIEKLKNTFMLLSLAIVVVPFLSVFRGFYQGLKELKVYAVSQVIEQIVRVSALLIFSFILVRILQFDSIFSIYVAVLSTSLAALSAVIYYLFFDRKHIGIIKRNAETQQGESVEKKEVIKEMLLFGLPYLVASFLGNSMSIVNNTFFMNAVNATKDNYENFKLILGIMQVQANKITSIPQVLAIGFSAGIVPYLTISLEKKDWHDLQKNVKECLATVLYVGMPLFLCILMFAGPIYYIMYGDHNLDLGRTILMWSSPIAITSTLSTITTSMMMTLRLRRNSLLYLLVGFIIKFLSFFLMIRTFGYIGALTSTVLASITIIYFNLRCINKTYFVNYKNLLKLCFKIFVSLCAMAITIIILNNIGINLVVYSRFTAALILAFYGIISITVFVFISNYLGLPKELFNLDLKELFSKIVKKQ